MAKKSEIDPVAARLAGFYGFILFLSWLHGTPAVLRGIAEACSRAADELERPAPVMLTAKQVGALIMLGSLNDSEKR